MPTRRWGLAAGVLNGILYAVGGYNGTNIVATVEAYDPATNAWTAKASMPAGRTGLATGVVDGMLYVVGGGNATHAYDPATNTWTTKALMPTSRHSVAAGVVNGIVYVVGGYRSGDLGAESTVEAYDPTTNTWTTKAPMPTARWGLAAGVVNGILYAVGGAGVDGSTLATVEAYDPESNTWTAKASMPTARDGLAAVVVNGILYAVGGGFLTTVEAYDPATNAWTTKAPMLTGRRELAANVVNGILYAVGGADANWMELAKVEAYQPATGGEGPNEPVGFTPYTDRSFDGMIEGGWAAQRESVPGGLGTVPIIVSDPSAPISPPNVGQITYPAGFTGAGYAPAQTFKDTTPNLGWKQVYVRFAVKLSSNWESHASGVNKIGFVWMHDNPVVYFSAQGQGPGSAPLFSELRLSSTPDGEVNLTQNLADPEFTRGQWHVWEVLLIANTGGLANGEAHWWIDGVKVGGYTGVRYANATQPNLWGGPEISWFPTWGGENGTPVAQEMYMWMDHYYLSGKP